MSVLVSLECVKKSLHAMKGSSTIAAEKTTRYNRDPINKLCLYFFRDKFGKSIRYQNSLLIRKVFSKSLVQVIFIEINKLKLMLARFKAKLKEQWCKLYSKTLQAAVHHSFYRFVDLKSQYVANGVEVQCTYLYLISVFVFIGLDWHPTACPRLCHLLSPTRFLLCWVQQNTARSTTAYIIYRSYIKIKRKYKYSFNFFF